MAATPLSNALGRGGALDDLASLAVSLGLSFGLIRQRTGVFAVYHVTAEGQFAHGVDLR